MALELGQSNDPRDLIPGRPEIVEDCADTLRRDATRLETVGWNLGKVRVDGWLGPASEGFQLSFAEEPVRWLKASDTATTAANALDRHAGTLRWAQAQAAEAIELWNAGEAATEQAATDNPAAATSSMTDPGEAKRQQAREILSRARFQLADVGGAVAADIGGANQGAGGLTWLRDIVKNTKGESKWNGPNAGREWEKPGTFSGATVDGSASGNDQYGNPT